MTSCLASSHVLILILDSIFPRVWPVENHRYSTGKSLANTSTPQEMPASEVGVAERTLNYTAGGVVAGSLIGLASAAYSKPAVGEMSLAYVGKTTGGHAAMFAAMAGIFAATDTFLDQSRGHSALNSVAAGCAAGAVVGARQGDPTRAAFGCALFGTVQAFGENLIKCPRARTLFRSPSPVAHVCRRRRPEPVVVRWRALTPCN